MNNEEIWNWLVSIADAHGVRDHMGEFVRVHDSWIEIISDKTGFHPVFLINESRETVEEYDADFFVWTKKDVELWKVKS